MFLRHAMIHAKFTLFCLAIHYSLSCAKSLSTPVPYSTTNKGPIPITVLSGFLGSGKTSLLENLLNNDKGLRIAIIVNDVASVNIDSKLISAKRGASAGATAAAAGMVELQNGCACCSLSEELLGSVSELVTLNDMRGEGEGFHHIVIELSGVADPKSVRAKFQEAVLYDMPLMERVQLDTMITVIDCSIFLDHLKNSKSLSPEEVPELFYPDGKSPDLPDTEDDWAKDIPPLLLEALMAGDKSYVSPAMRVDQNSGVAELLVSQTEICDVILLNKVDLTDSATISTIQDIATALNPRAKILRSEFGRVPFTDILGVAKGRGVVQAGVVDDHKDAVEAALRHSHEHAVSEHTEEKNDATIDDKLTTQSESHSHEHAHSHSHDCHDPTCNDPSHKHDDEHGHDHDQCDDPTCTDPSHSHSHSHSHDQCDDPTCTDPTHSHSHSSNQHASLGTYVYQARRPFHPGRLLSFLRQMPITRGLPAKTEQDPSCEVKLSQLGSDMMGRILRSKGFAWCADSNEAALYWSHAGTSFELSVLGRWWATLPREQWPAEAVPAILGDFDSTQHNEADENYSSVGDRRQEIVFIGTKLNEAAYQKELSEALDKCILDQTEWSSFKEKKSDETSLRTMFPTSIESRVMSF